jgi:hypothetical protein
MEPVPAQSRFDPPQSPDRAPFFVWRVAAVHGDGTAIRERALLWHAVLEP